MHDPLNILFYQDQFPAFGGIETVTALLSDAFARQGNNVFVLAHHAAGNESLVPQSLTDSVFHMPDVVHATSRKNRSFLRTIVESRKIDIVMFQDSYAKIEDNLSVLPPGVKLVVVEHNTPAPILGPVSGKGFFGRGIEAQRRFRIVLASARRHRKLYRMSDVYVLLSNRFAGEFRLLTQLSDYRKLHAIPNPLPTGSVSVPSEKVTHKQNAVLFLGTLCRRKGCDLLLFAWKTLQKHFPEWSLVFVGDGPMRKELESFARNNNLDRISFVGAQPNPYPWLERSSILAFPSRYEGFGMVLLEAMSRRCVPVCFDSYSALHDIVQDHSNGLIVPAFDLPAFIAAMSDMMSNHALRDQLAEQATKSVEKFSEIKVVKQWTALFRSLSKNDNSFAKWPPDSPNRSMNLVVDGH